MPVFFHNEKITFHLKDKRKLKAWVESTILSFKKIPGDINFVLGSDEYLFRLNKKYLDHHAYTDILTFDTSALPEAQEGRRKATVVQGDIFISIERVRDNAKELGVSFSAELHRVMIHGILHLLGFRDKTNKDKEMMRKEEDRHLRKLETDGV